MNDRTALGRTRKDPVVFGGPTEKRVSPLKVEWIGIKEHIVVVVVAEADIGYAAVACIAYQMAAPGSDAESGRGCRVGRKLGLEELRIVTVSRHNYVMQIRAVGPEALKSEAIWESSTSDCTHGQREDKEEEGYHIVIYELPLKT
jgi:hypothetical protein